MDLNDETFIRCQCFAEILHVSRDSDTGEVYMAAYEPRTCGKLPWKYRLKHIWRIMTHGHPWWDNIIMSKEDAEKFAAWLLESGKVETNPWGQ